MSNSAPVGDTLPADAVTGLAAFRHRDFRLFFIGKFLALTSFHMILVAIAYQVYELTGDPMDLAYIGLAMFGPAIGFALITGYVADRFNRKVVLASCYGLMLIAALLFYLLTIIGLSVTWPVYAILVILGTGRAFYFATSNALLPNLVPLGEFSNAVAWNTTSNKTAQIVGPAGGGLLYLWGPEIVYATASVIFVFATATTALIQTRTHREGKEPISFETLFAGLHYVWEKKIVLGAISLDLFVVLMGGVTALLPVYAKDILEVGASGAGFLRSAMAAGGVITALMLTRINMTHGVGRILFGCVTLFGLATIVFGVSEWYLLSLAAMATLGAADMVSVIIRNTLLQIATPDDKRGRVSAVNSVFVGASNEIGEFRAGVMAAWLGAVPAVVIGGVGSIVIAGLFWKLFPELVRVNRLDRSLW